jgi:hypothetical protein
VLLEDSLSPGGNADPMYDGRSQIGLRLPGYADMDVFACGGISVAGAGADAGTERPVGVAGHAHEGIR